MDYKPIERKIKRALQRFFTAQLPPTERVLQALILSQYRLKLFNRHHVQAKPVILFKSKTIADSETFFQTFIQNLKQLQATTIDDIRHKSNTGIIQEAFAFMDEHGISSQALADELKTTFDASRCLVVYSKNDTAQKQLLLNSLEDERNPYRAVFAVDKLNEGWDVLNLFDIVRLYDTRATQSGRASKTTISEAQLIGRGARYYPFRLAPGLHCPAQPNPCR